jgi:hypothetical protein
VRERRIEESKEPPSTFVMISNKLLLPRFDCVFTLEILLGEEKFTQKVDKKFQFLLRVLLAAERGRRCVIGAEIASEGASVARHVCGGFRG